MNSPENAVEKSDFRIDIQGNESVTGAKNGGSGE
jgi:hypothetical protein